MSPVSKVVAIEAATGLTDLADREERLEDGELRKEIANSNTDALDVRW